MTAAVTSLHRVRLLRESEYMSCFHADLCSAFGLWYDTGFVLCYGSLEKYIS